MPISRDDLAGDECREIRRAARARPAPAAAWPRPWRRSAASEHGDSRRAAAFAAGHRRSRAGRDAVELASSPTCVHAGEPGEGGFAPQPHGGDPNGNGERRHRRRGRRGGRRNRRDREPRMARRCTATAATSRAADFHGGEMSQPDFGAAARCRSTRPARRTHEPALTPAARTFARMRRGRSPSPRSPLPAPSAPPAAAPPLDGARARAGVRRQRARRRCRRLPAPEPAPVVTSRRPTTPASRARPAGGPNASWVATRARAERDAEPLDRSRRPGGRRSLRQGGRRARPGAARLHHAPARRRSQAGPARRRQHLGQDAHAPISPATRPTCSASRATGADMAAIEPRRHAGGAARAAAEAARAATTSPTTEWCALQRANLIDPSAPNPSVETLLHAFMPHKFVDHTHATAVLSLIDQPDGEAAAPATSMASSSGIVPYRRPGFGLAKAAAADVRRQSEGRRPDPAQARHLHLRRRRARSLRAHDRDGDARRSARWQRNRKAVFVTAQLPQRVAPRADGRADHPRRRAAAPTAATEGAWRRPCWNFAAATPCSISSTARTSRATPAPASSRRTTPSAPRTGR